MGDRAARTAFDIDGLGIHAGLVEDVVGDGVAVVAIGAHDPPGAVAVVVEIVAGDEGGGGAVELDRIGVGEQPRWTMPVNSFPGRIVALVTSPIS